MCARGGRAAEAEQRLACYDDQSKWSEWCMFFTAVLHVFWHYEEFWRALNWPFRLKCGRFKIESFGCFWSSRKVEPDRHNGCWTHFTILAILQNLNSFTCLQEKLKRSESAWCKLLEFNTLYQKLFFEFIITIVAIDRDPFSKFGWSKEKNLKGKSHSEDRGPGHLFCLPARCAALARGSLREKSFLAFFTNFY